MNMVQVINKAIGIHSFESQLRDLQTERASRIAKADASTARRDELKIAITAAQVSGDPAEYQAASEALAKFDSSEEGKLPKLLEGHLPVLDGRMPTAERAVFRSHKPSPEPLDARAHLDVHGPFRSFARRDLRLCSLVPSLFLVATKNNAWLGIAARVFGECCADCKEIRCPNRAIVPTGFVVGIVRARRKEVAHHRADGQVLAFHSAIGSLATPVRANFYETELVLPRMLPQDGIGMK